MPKFGDLDSTFSKTNVRFDISTFEIGYMRNFVKIRELILTKYPNLYVWARNVQKAMPDLKSTPLK